MRDQKKILIIEDDTVLRSNTQELLEFSGYKVITSSDGIKGVDAAKIHAPDLILCDILMPGLNGYEVFEVLNKDKSTRFIPFIFVSSKSEFKDVRKGMNFGADDYITKPFTEKDLLDAIKSRISKYEDINHDHPNFKYSKQEQSEDITTLKELLIYFKEKGEIIKVAKNKPVYKEQKHANYVYLVEKGLIKIHRMDEYGKELTTGLNKRGEFFGFYSFKEISSYPETATCLTPSILLRISNFKFYEILSRNSNLTIELAQLLSDKLSALKTHLLEMAYGSVLKKTSNTILQFAEKNEDEQKQSIKICRNDLANVAGISTESLIRSLSLLKKERLIDIDGRNIKILNVNKLQSIK